MKISQREKFFLAMGVMAVVLIGAYLGLDHWFQTRARMKEEQEQKELLLARYQRTVEREPGLRRELIAAKAKLNGLHQKLLKGRTVPLAAAELQKFLDERAAQVGLDIKRERILEPVKTDYYQEIAVEINTMSTLTKLAEFLYQVESAPFVLKIKEFQIRGDNPREPRQMMAKLVVGGLILALGEAKGEASPPKTGGGSAAESAREGLEDDF